MGDTNTHWTGYNTAGCQPEWSAERWVRSLETYRSAVSAFMSAVQHRRSTDHALSSPSTPIHLAVAGTQNEGETQLARLRPGKPKYHSAVARGELTRFPLTARECEVAVLIARGLTNKQIAETLVITQGTAANHVAAILDRLDLRTRTQIAVWVFESGQLSIDATDAGLASMDYLIEHARRHEKSPAARDPARAPTWHSWSDRRVALMAE